MKQLVFCDYAVNSSGILQRSKSVWQIYYTSQSELYQFLNGYANYSGGEIDADVIMWIKYV